ncbi:MULTISPECIES: M28 family peptidase [Arenibacter]|uniref:M28 family peptidase n=1 Tax=Arenibacter TaxID=178469 RepID=UPI0004DEE097|nr:MULTISPECIES: M28 family peptidase [Arenibacter]GBF21177.1 aminopeptidase S [Arenibacter sp. NBRC 103722]
MKQYSSAITLLLVLLAIYWSFEASMPSYTPDTNIENISFSTDRALVHVKNMSQKPHAVGFPAHSEVREYIISELTKLGLETSTQQGYTAGDWGNFSSATNILARIKGSEKGKALLLLSHYDSNPHSSLGASDAASGVATILEGVRAFLEQNNTPKNDIIILISDGEELGLNGADLFVSHHPWVKEVGLVLNFEARGSGGPSYMLLETNRGNSKVIDEFIKANPKYPAANSLVYSVYKMLPNDTDLTVFREDMDIEGLNFAFIDDHYDYHTARDNYERLDRNTLAHQGSYLMPLLKHFSNSDLTNLKSPNDSIYFNMPFFRLVSYPFDWIFPMLVLAIAGFLALLFLGLRNSSLEIKEIGRGFVPLFIILAINGLVGYFGWTVLKNIYPQYQDILHGFTYNGYSYIAAFVLFSVAVSFWAYHKFGKAQTQNLLIAPLLLWLILCTLVAVYLKGASFFVIPLFALLASMLILTHQKLPSPYLLLVLALPAIWIYSPLIKMFPVGLGLKMMITATLLTSLAFFLLLPIFGPIKKKNRLAYLFLILCFGFLLSAHFSSGFDKENAKPTSLVYILDADKNTAQWATYDHVLSSWTSQYVEANKAEPKNPSYDILSSKYGTGFTYTSEAPVKNIAPPKIETILDTIIGDHRKLEICLTPQRSTNRLEIFTNDVEITKATINRIELSEYYLKNRKNSKLVTHYVSNNDYTELQITIPKESALELTLYEASNDLLNNPLFTVPPRPENNIPMPFVLNDAILVSKKIKF